MLLCEALFVGLVVEQASAGGPTSTASFTLGQSYQLSLLLFRVFGDSALSLSLPQASDSERFLEFASIWRSMLSAAGLLLRFLSASHLTGLIADIS